MLDVADLCASYGRARILRDVSFSLAQGEAMALLGRNGAGKSTTIKSIIGLVRPTSGTIRFEGHEIAGLPAHRIARAGIGYVPEERRIFADLTVAENLEAGRRPCPPGQTPWTWERITALFPSLGPMRDRPGGRMSGGEQQMLAIARTLMGHPRLLLLDEPSEGLAPVVVTQMREAIAALMAQGTTVLLAEQNLAFAAKLARQAAVIETGRIVWRGPMQQLLADDTLRAAYLHV